MARTNTAVFAARKGATLDCRKGHPIQKGERYWWVKPRSAWRKMIACSAHPFKRSEVDQSKMSAVWAAIEDATENLDAMRGSPEDDTSSITSELESVAQSARDVAQEYRDAADASPTGYVFGEDLNERADSIESGADEIDQWTPDDEEPDFDQCENSDHEDDEDNEDAPIERGDVEKCSDCAAIKDQWWDEQIDEAISAMDNASFD